MPYVNIRITNESVSKIEKAELVSGVIELLERVLNKNSKTTIVVIDEVETDNWGISGELALIIHEELLRLGGRAALYACRYE